jgi:hypothetical protein
LLFNVVFLVAIDRLPYSPLTARGRCHLMIKKYLLGGDGFSTKAVIRNSSKKQFAITKIISMYSLADYENYIHSNFISDQLGIDLRKFSHKTFENDIQVDLYGTTFLDFEKFKQEINPVTHFVQAFYLHRTDKPVWYKLDVADQAVNQSIAIGFLNLENGWLKFITDYLNNDRAEQNGDTIITIFDIDFKWAVCFTLSQDESILKVEKFEY